MFRNLYDGKRGKKGKWGEEKASRSPLSLCKALLPSSLTFPSKQISNHEHIFIISCLSAAKKQHESLFLPQVCL